MASPQVENGYTRLANELFDQIHARDFSKRQLNLLYQISRFSFGCKGNKTAYIPKTGYFELFGTPKQHVAKELTQLLEMKVINRTGDYYTINKNYDEWTIKPAKTFNEDLFKDLIKLNLQKANMHDSCIQDAQNVQIPCTKRAALQPEQPDSAGDITPPKDSKRKLNNIGERKEQNSVQKPDKFFDTPAEKIIQEFNRLCPNLIKCSGLSHRRRTDIIARWEEHPELSYWQEVFRQANNVYVKNTKWKPTLDWLFQNDTNYIKILEGQYTTKNSKTTSRASPDNKVIDFTDYEKLARN